MTRDENIGATNKQSCRGMSAKNDVSSLLATATFEAVSSTVTSGCTNGNLPPPPHRLKILAPTTSSSDRSNGGGAAAAADGTMLTMMTAKTCFFPMFYQVFSCFIKVSPLL